MELLGLGLGEWLAVLVLILLLFGPKDMAANARKIAIWVRKVTHSEFWRDMRETGREISQIPAQLAQEAGLEEWQQTRREWEQEIGSIMPPGAINRPAPLVTEPVAEPAEAVEVTDPVAEPVTEPVAEPVEAVEVVEGVPEPVEGRLPRTQE